MKNPAICDALQTTRHLVDAAFMAPRDVEEANERNALRTLLDLAVSRLDETIAGLEGTKSGAVHRPKSARA